MQPCVANDGPGLLLTGATGFLGGEVLGRVLERSERPVYVLVRADSDEQAERRLEPSSRRVVAVAADLARPGLGLDPARRAWLAERVDRIVHCAASVSFGLGLAESR